jgi:formyl-CoA transferase
MTSAPHPLHGSIDVEGPRVLLSRTPGEAGAVPLLGEHTERVLTELLGYDAGRMEELRATGALT